MSSDLNTTAATPSTTDVVAPDAPAPVVKEESNDADDAADAQQQQQRCMLSGCFCCYTAFDCKNIELCLKYESDWCFCIRHACCLSITSKPLGCGITTNKDGGDGDWCKVAAYCCDLGLVKPVSCCSGAHTCLCCYKVHSFPCNERFIEKCVCACCFVSCAPTCGCCVAPPECPALNKLRNIEVQPLKMDRGDDNNDLDLDDNDVEEEDAAAPAPVPEVVPEVVAEVIQEQPKVKVVEGEDKEMHA
jgi:hypothetical protein